MLPLLIPILSSLASNGLNTLVNAITIKGKEIVEDKLGIKIPNDVNDLTPELLSQLKMKEMEHESDLLAMALEQKKLEIESKRIDADSEKAASEAVTARWLGDMTSDSWLSKNIRPMTLIFILTVYTIFSLLSAAHIDVNVEYVKLLAQWGMIVMSAYFVGRTVEKIKGVE
jgi:hypothetical protein